ncbi:MAG: PLP-dependent aminotransferase family protein [Pseudomonadota bacterium]
MTPLKLTLDRSARLPVAGQIAQALRTAITQGQLARGARLPSWRDLAAQLGVARGTVQAAYEALADAQLIVSSGAAGTHVARQVLPEPSRTVRGMAAMRDPIADYPQAAGVFQMGMPAQDGFPAKAWARIAARAARDAAHAPLRYPDPRGEDPLRTAIAAYLAVARGMACSPAQVFVVSGHTAGIALSVQALGVRGRAWCEDPGYPPTRDVLAALSIARVAVPVDAQGLDVAAGVRAAPDAALAVVTPGQQAPLGVGLSPARRRALLDWAAASGAWVLEDDYLSELQLQGRAAPSLAATDSAGRVLHLGTFSKTISPALRLGFLVVPAEQVPRFDAAARLFGSAPPPPVQNAVTAFLQGGHLLRHLRRMKRLYLQRRDALVACLRAAGADHRTSGLSVLVRLPEAVSDVELARAARQHGLAPVPLSPWYCGPGVAHTGLLLGVTNVPVQDAARHYATLQALMGRHAD